MSNYHDLYCLPCGDSCGLSVNHGRTQINALVQGIPAMRAFFDAEPDKLYLWDIDLGYIGESVSPRAIVHWYEAHQHHHIVIREEYGDLHELTPPEPRPASPPVRYCPGCGWPGGKHAPDCPDMVVSP